MRPISASLVVLLALALTTGWAFSHPTPEPSGAPTVEQVLDEPSSDRPEARAGLLREVEDAQPEVLAPDPEAQLEVRRRPAEPSTRGLTVPVPDLKESTWGY